MVNLLMRFFEINKGSISIDGISTTELKRENIHNLFSMVLQDTWLFEGTVEENLVYNMDTYQMKIWSVSAKPVEFQDLYTLCRTDLIRF